MSASEKMTKLGEKERSVDFVEKASFAKLKTIESKSYIPRFASHTLSSLMKTRTPINAKKKSSSMKSARASKKSPIKSIVKLNGINKRRSITKQSKSMHALITILKREKRDHPASAARQQDSELTGTDCERAENSLVFLPSDLIKDISRDLKKCASPMKSMVSRGEPAKVIDQSKKRLEDLQKKIDSCLSPCLQNNPENIKDRTIIDVAQQSSDEEKKFANSHREVKVLHRGSRPDERSAEDFSNEACSVIKAQIHWESVSTNVNDDATTDHHKYAFRGNRKTWMIRKAETRDVDRMYNVDLRGSRNSKFMTHVDNSRDKDDRSVVNCPVSTRRTGAFQKNHVFNQRVWKPPGITKSSIIKSTMSLTQPTSQKSSSRSTERSIVSTENKYLSIEHVEMINSEPTNTSTSVNQSKVLMKENRDPRANRITKICEHLAEVKQRQRLQSGGTLPKRGRSITKVGSKNRNDVNPTRSKSRPHHWQTVTPRESSQKWNEQNRTESAVIYNRRSRPSEVINALKEIINSVKEDEDIKENANVSNNDVFNSKEDDSGLQTLSNRDVSTEISRNDEANFIKNKHFDEPNPSLDQPFWKSISTQTEEDLDSKEIFKLTQITTQLSQSCNNVIETGCNTMHYNDIYKDTGVSCDLINSTNSKDIDSTIIEDKTPLLKDVPIQTECITYAESNAKDKYSDKSEKLPISECKQNLSTDMILKLEEYDTTETPAKTTNNFIRDEEKIMDETSQTFLKLSKNYDDKTNIDIDSQHSNDSLDNLFSDISPSLLYDYDSSDACCSSDQFTENFHRKNDGQPGDMDMSELKKSIPGDVMAAFELAAERACNLRKAVTIYYENLIPGGTEKREEGTIMDENSETFLKLSKNSDDKTNIDIDSQHSNDLLDNLFSDISPSLLYDYDSSDACCSSDEFTENLHRKNDGQPGDYETERCENFVNREIENRRRSEFDGKYCRFDVADGEDVDGSSTCSSRSSNYFPIHGSEIVNLSSGDYCELVSKKKIKSLGDLISEGVRRQEKEYARKARALELKKGKNNGTDFEAAGAIKTLALPMTVENTSSIISRENLLPLICCILCSIVFLYLQFSFQCNPAT